MGPRAGPAVQSEPGSDLQSRTAHSDTHDQTEELHGAVIRAERHVSADEDLVGLADLIATRHTLVLSGAGISTESGIPDYRSPERLANPRKPMTYSQFVGSAGARRRYWARSLVGWQAVGRARPNSGHQAIARLEREGRLTGVITQNVDGLHQAAGSREVIELHGSLWRIRCLECGLDLLREEFQGMLLAANGSFDYGEVEIAPDGDAVLPDELIAGFSVPACPRCHGMLKPDVVFFGENVPKERVLRSMARLQESDLLLVVGSSLTVMSGLRFALAAQRAGTPVAIVNDGPTRADSLATLKVTGRLGEVLPGLAEALA